MKASQFVLVFSLVLSALSSARDFDLESLGGASNFVQITLSECPFMENSDHVISSASDSGGCSEQV